MTLIIGNVIGLIGSIAMVIGGNLKDKNKALTAQTMQLLFLSISNLVLGSIPGFIMNLISVIRNILSSFNKLNKIAITCIIFLSTILTIKYNNLGIIGYLPLINNTIFIIFMNTKNDISFKLLTILYMILWLIHNVYIKAYTTSIFNIITLVSSIIAILRIKKKMTNTKLERKV